MMHLLHVAPRYFSGGWSVYLFAPFLLVLLCCCSPVFGQQGGTLSGTVIDNQTGSPLSGVTVFVVGTYKGAYTDEAGKFRIEGIKPGEYSIRISYIGYAEKKINGVQILAGGVRSLEVAMTPKDMTTETVEIIGEANLVDLESGQSTVSLDQDQIEEMAVQDVQDIAALQAGVNVTPDGLQVRGGRVYETQYLVDGVSAQDPLAGTGFGVDVNSSAISELEVITGGAGAEYAGGTAGVISTRIREGGERYQVSGQYQRDNTGIDALDPVQWNTDELQLAVSGPFLPAPSDPEKPMSGFRRLMSKKLSFFASGSMRLTDEYFKITADQLNSSVIEDSELFAPRQDNRWNGTFKIAYEIKPGTKLTFSTTQSLNINQNTRSLQIIGNDEVMVPGFQYYFSQNLDNANTYTHRSGLDVLNFQTVLSDKWTMKLSAGRLRTHLRADANGRPFRDENPTQIYDPSSIVTDPVTVFNPGDSVVFVNPGPGLMNNGGIATLWHDHWVGEYTGRVKLNYNPTSEVHYFTMGWEHQEQDLQWVDVTRPWVGAPIQINDSVSFSSNRIGTSNDIWEANPAKGAFFLSDNIRYKGINATIGVRFSYWAMGDFADDAVENPEAPVLDPIREDYRDETVDLGRRFKARILPKIRVSFPVTENNVLYFNYTHALRHPHPRFVYAGLDPVYQNNSFLPNLGNPNLNPESTVSYELGLKTQFNANTALTVVAYYNDKYDFIVNRRVTVRDFTGRFVQKSFFINQDYARIRGLEVTFFKRIGDWFRGTVSASYQLATGKSNSALESRLQIQQTGRVETTEERPLAWDRPLDIKTQLIFKTDTTMRPFHDFRIYVNATYKSGLRYTPFEFAEIDEVSGRPRYVPQDGEPFSEIGSPWFWTDVRITRDFLINRKKRQFISLFVLVENIFDNRNAAIINPVTGEGYQAGDPVPDRFRDPRYPSPLDFGQPPTNPARWLQPRHVMFGVKFKF